MRVADALLIPNEKGITQKKYQALVKANGLQKARAMRIDVEVEE